MIKQPPVTLTKATTTTPPRICMVVHQDYFQDARVKRYAESLVEHGVEVDVLCLRGDGGNTQAQHRGLTVIPVPLARNSLPFGGYIAEYGAALILFSIWLFVLHLRRRYGVIHVHNMPDFLIFSALAPRLLGARLILDVHDPMPEFWTTKFGRDMDDPPIRVLKLQEKFSAAIAHAVLTANSNFKDRLVNRGIAAGKISVIQNSPDEKIFERARYPRKQPDPDRFVLIYPGTIAPRYGLETAIRAVAQLSENLPQLRLQIIGSQNAHSQELKTLAEQLGVASKVAFLPPVSVEEIPRYLAEADAGIYPALPDHHMSIAMPSKVLEYAVMGVPIIASRLQVLEDQFSDQAILYFEPGDTSALAGCILRLYHNPKLRQSLAEAADNEYVNRHRWQDEFMTYVRVLQGLLPKLAVQM